MLQYARLLFKENERKKQMSVLSPFTYHGFAVRQEVRLMIEADLLVIIYLLFNGMIASTIINVALIIALAIIFKQQ